MSEVFDVNGIQEERVSNKEMCLEQDDKLCLLSLHNIEMTEIKR